jgi:hypothetical protein
MPELDPLGPQLGQRRPTQKQNAPDALAERGGVDFQFANETRRIAHRRLSLKSPDVVSTVKSGDEVHVTTRRKASKEDAARVLPFPRGDATGFAGERPEPPRSIELEQAVIAALLRNVKLIAVVRECGLLREHFFDPLLAHFYETILRRDAAGKLTDARILRALVPSEVEREEVGKLVLADRTDDVQAYAAILTNLATKRLQILIHEDGLAEAYSMDGPTARESSDRTIIRLRVAADAIAPVDLNLVFGCDAEISARPDIRPGIPPRSAVALVGPSRSGKTTYIVDAMVSVANDPDAPGAVLYVPLEGRAGIGKRLRAAERRHGATGNRFAYYTGTGSLGTPDPTFASAIIAAAKTVAEKTKLPVKIIAIDTFPRALSGEDENSAAVTTAALNHVERIIAETGASVVLVCHPGKDKERGVRGSSALFAGLDAVIEIEHDGEAPSPRSVLVRKAKDGPEGPIGAFTLEAVVVGVDAAGADVASCNIRPCEGVGRGGPRRLKPGSAADKAVKELHELVNAERGEIAKGHARAPDGARLIPLALWRDACRRKRLSTGESADVENRAFLRAVSMLTDAGHIGEFDSVVWMLAGQRRSTGSRPQ